MGDNQQVTTGQVNTVTGNDTAAAAPSTTPATTTTPAKAEPQGTPAQTGPAASGSVLAQAKEPGDGKDAEAKKDGDSGAKEQDKKPASAPEKYEFKVPDGMTVDQKMVDAFVPIAKEFDLSQEKAQKLVDLHARHIAGMAEAYDKAHQEQLAKWEQEVKSIPNSGELLGYARRAVNRLVDGDDAKVFLESDVGNHPAVIRLLGKVGKLISEDRHPDGASGQREESLAHVLYGNSMSKR